MTDTIGVALTAATRRLTQAGIASARLDSRVLLAHVLGVQSTALFSRPETPLEAADALRFEAFLVRREAREPVSRIIGKREFWSLEFVISPAVLDPRPDSETLVSTVLEAVPDRSAPLRLLDLGTGSGCLLLALLSELPYAQGTGIDIDPAAVEVAQRNARALGLAGRTEFQQGNWGDGPDSRRGPFDLIVSNPPYIEDRDIAGLEPEVSRWDPRSALAGGEDGLACIRVLAPQIRELLAPNGIAVLEFGAGQEMAVEAILSRSGFRNFRRVRDLAGQVRCISATVG